MEHSPWGVIIGPCFTADTLARALGVSVDEIEQADRDAHILGIETAEGARVYPAFQLVDGVLVRHLDQVLAELRRCTTVDGLTIAQWLAVPAGECEIVRQIDRLAAGDVDAVVKAARYAAASWSA